MSSTTTSRTPTRSGIRIRSRVRAGGTQMQHNQAAKGLRVKSRVKAGSPSVSEIVVTKTADCNHSQAAKGLRVRSGAKAGLSLNFTKISF